MGAWGPQTAVGEVCFAGLGALDGGFAAGELSHYRSVPAARGARREGYPIRGCTLFAGLRLLRPFKAGPACHPLARQQAFAPCSHPADTGRRPGTARWCEECIPPEGQGQTSRSRRTDEDGLEEGESDGTTSRGQGRVYYRSGARPWPQSRDPVGGRAPASSRSTPASRSVRCRTRWRHPRTWPRRWRGSGH